MNKRIFGNALLLLPLCCMQSIAQIPKAPATLYSFESEQDLKAVSVENGRLSIAPEALARGRNCLRVTFAESGDAVVRFHGGAPWDWVAFGGIGFDLINPSADEIRFSVQFRDASGKTVSGGGIIAPGLSVDYAFPLGPSSPFEHGMVGGPPFPGTVPVTYAPRNRIDEKHVVEWQLKFTKPRAASIVCVGGVRLLPPVSYDRIVDAFGQYTREDWPGKLKSEAELADRRKQEEAQVSAVPVLADRDEYGGWASGPSLAPTGFFTTAQRDGKWWLVDPEGRLFFSAGMDVMTLQDGPTLVERRESMFTWLPGKDDPLAKHFGDVRDVLYGPIKQGRSFNFYAANLERKYGADFVPAWQSFSLARIRAWGFNTIGNWSDPELFALQRVPYTLPIEIHGDYARVASGNDYWGKMHDVFDPKFAAAVDESVREGTAKYRDDPWCIGTFVDNEVSWGGGENDRQHFGLAYGALAAKAGSPSKLEFLRQLRARYSRIADLNAAWHTKFESWDQLAQPYQAADELTPATRSDFQQFLAAFADRYFRIIRDALRKYDPHHLYLGCRFAWNTPEAVAAAARYADVVSFNVYRSHLEPSFCPPELHKPCLVGEFHFGALDRGMFHTGLVMAPNQAARAQLYRQYLNSALDNAGVVGVHWFEYTDEPLTGRTYDGENYNIGFVDVTDTPYPEMVDAAKVVHATIYKRHSTNQQSPQH